MARKIPKNFNFKKINLDDNELYIRDTLHVNIENWAKFRYSIHIGNNANVLKSEVAIPQKVKSAYVELAKSHYEAINSIGYMKLAYDEFKLIKPTNNFFYVKALKDFYINSGSVLDNLARLIFIINDPDSPTKVNRRGNLVRHWIDWPQLARDYKDCFNGYKQVLKSRKVKEILNIRNNFIHNWRCIILFDKNYIPYWPKAIRSKRNFFWHYEEKRQMKSSYRSYIKIQDIVHEDYIFMEDFQNKIFENLIKAVRTFERNQNVEIQ